MSQQGGSQGAAKPPAGGSSSSSQQQTTSERIAASQAQLRETEELGTQLLSTLQGQREQLKRTKEAAKAANEAAKESDGIITRMSKRWFSW
mmetsp:Transcript_45036/g.143423  ORF Transcript_45036/g.143423 Transcript_45036/m.143423 type:complete len:91 (-) Transcript_45036:1209-1481(-)